jgi:hypothetical protein
MKWKFIHIHVVPAETRQEAIDKFVASIHSNTVDNFFETEIIKKYEEPVGWFGQVRNQLTGRK